MASDHHLLIAEIRLHITRIQRREKRLGPRFNTRRLEDQAVKRPFAKELDINAGDIPEGGYVEEQWTAIERVYHG